MINPETFRPLGNRVLVKRMALPEQTRGGLYMLGREYPTFGTVIAIGSGRRTRNGHRAGISEVIDRSGDSLRVGDIVHFHKEAVRRELVFHELGEDYVLLDGEYCLLRIREVAS
jgi:co-chaperonin GroES (HSP10)